MSEATPNRGVSKRLTIYVEDKALGRDFLQVKSFKWQEEAIEDEDSYLGRVWTKPAKQPKGASGSFTIEESDSTYVAAVNQAIRTAETTGQRPKVVLVLRTYNNSGPTGKVEFRDVTLKPSGGASGQYERVPLDYSFRSGEFIES